MCPIELESLLMSCEDEDDVEEAFVKNNIVDYGQRVDYLTECLGNPEINYGGKAESTQEAENISKYLTVRSMFVTGSWR
jgi:hypothetical protein